MNRAYYAVFYAATAVLLQRGRHFVRHAGVRSAFHEELIKTRLMSVEFGEAYDMLFERRLLADYGALVEVSRDEADRSLADASRLVAALKRLAATGGAAS